MPGTKWRRLLRDERGFVVVWVALSLSALVGAAGFSIDLGSLFMLRSKLQTTADAASLAAAVELPDADNVKTAAIQYADLNLPVADHGNTLVPTDVVIGNWDTITKTFTAGINPTNAVQVTIRRSQVNGNPAQTYFAGVMGFDSVDIVASAVAYPGVSCFDAGVIVGGTIDFSQNALLDTGYCFYGYLGVHFAQNGTVDGGSAIGALDGSTITYDAGFSVPDGELAEANIPPITTADVAQMIDDIENGINLPPHITQVQVITPGDVNGGFTPTPGTAYVVNGNVDIDQAFTFTDGIFAVRGEIEWGQNGRILNSSPCAVGDFATGIIATGTITLGQDAKALDVQMITGGDLHLDQNSEFRGKIRVAGNAFIDQAPNFTQCEDAIEGGGGGVARILQLVL